MAIAVGLHRGFPVTKRTRKHAERKPRTFHHLCHDVIREVCGYAPYERRVLELLRNGLDKRALRVCKRKLGSMARAKHKREELNTLMQKARLERQSHMEHHHHDDAKKKKAAARKEKAKAKKAEAAAAETKKQ